ncbi:MucBP domain-containing protein [uncultured Dubosiella sp.]|uniref:MucBP domain-containing protein n=1 Tax=uncultured Dubosiella sp. TaxID=1937011 RepID=UPI00272B916F|nr:MucBP domain-containing protein [uncultured Dubosiella sp.]
MQKKLIPFMIAAAMLSEGPVPLLAREEKPAPAKEAETNNQDDKEKEPVEESGQTPEMQIETISKNTANKTFKLEEGKALRFESTDDSIVTIFDCTFELSGKTLSDGDDKTRNLKEYFKLFVGDNVVFDHCDFKTQGSQTMDSITDSNLFLQGENIVFKKCTFSASHYEGRYLSAYMGEATFLDCHFDIQDHLKQPAFNVTEAKVQFDNTTIDMTGMEADQPCVYANSQDSGALSFVNNSKLTIKNNKADAMQLNATPVELQNSKVLVQNNQNGIAGGTWTLKKKSNVSSLENAGIGLSIFSPMTIDDSTMLLNGNTGQIDGFIDVDFFMNNTTLVLKNVKDVTLGSYVSQGSTIEKEDDSVFEGTKLVKDEAETLTDMSEPKKEETSDETAGADEKQPAADEKDDAGDVQQKPAEVKKFDVTVRYIDSQTDEDLHEYVVYGQPEGENYNFQDLIEANVPKDFKIVAVQGEVSGTLAKPIEIVVSVQPISRYYVRVNYLNIENDESIHPSNQVVGLKEDAKWDVSKFDKIEINGYEYVKTDRETKGDGLKEDTIINVYYKKIIPNSLQPNQKPSKLQGTNTSAKTNEGFYITIGFVALAAVLLLVVKFFTRKDQDEDKEE